jgi:hypothetical protein
VAPAWDGVGPELASVGLAEATVFPGHLTLAVFIWHSVFWTLKKNTKYFKSFF